MQFLKSDHPLVHNWWTFIVRGIFAIIFGVLAFAMPAVTIFALVMMFGAYTLVDGIASIVGALRGGQSRKRSVLLFLQGLVSIGAGIVALGWPGIGAVALLYVIAFWAVFIGGLEIITAIRLRKVIQDEWMLSLTGVLAVLFGLLLLFSPKLGALAVIFQIGLFAIVYGGVLIALGLRLRSWGGVPGEPRLGGA